MNTVKLKQFPASASFNNLMDDFFMQFPSLYRDDSAAGVNKTIPVNVREVENGYQVEVIVPGFNKEDIKVNLENNQITISAAKKQEATNGKVIRSEYKYQAFKRTFNLDEKIDTEKIEGKYENGVLTLNLCNKEEVKAPVKQITIQ
jgi:HSP20 family protein